MRATVIYDSVKGNTEQIARAVAAGIAGGTEAVRVGNADVGRLKPDDLLVVGSPTFGGRPTEAIQDFIGRIPPEVARSLTVAAFDTRLTMKFARIFGYAADKIADKLERAGSTVGGTPEGFIVVGRNGPLAKGELERARAWGGTLAGARLPTQ